MTFKPSITILLLSCIYSWALPDEVKKDTQPAPHSTPRNTFMVFGNTYITKLETKTSILTSINKAVKDADIDFVIMVGELTIGATVDQFNAVKYVMDHSPVPVYVTASNHDLVYGKGGWKSGKHDDYARFRKMLKTETEYTFSKGRSHFIMQSHTDNVGTNFTKKEIEKIKDNNSYDFVYHVIEASLGPEIDRKNKPMIGINGGSKKGAKCHMIENRHARVVPIENKYTDNEDDYLIFKENEGYVMIDSYVDRSLNNRFKMTIDRTTGTCSVQTLKVK